MVTQVEARTSKTIPYLREYPLIGSYYAFMRNRLALFLRIAQAGEACAFHVGSVPIVMFNKPEHVQCILVEHAYDFSKGRLMHKAMTSNGLFMSEGEFHRRQRKLLAPPFQPRHVASYADTMAHYGEQIQVEWSDGTIIDLNRQMTALTMSIVGKVLFNANVFSETDELGEAMAIGFEYSSYKLSSFISVPLSWPTIRNLRMRKAIGVIEARMQSMIDERRRSTQSAEIDDFLSILLQARDDDGSKMSDQQVMDECITLFGTGHETTASALSWAWYLLCQYPEVYQRLQQEVDRVLQGRTPTYADLTQLPYCLQVFKEAMRLYPPGATIMREALDDLEIGGYRVPRGSLVLLSPYTIHRMAEYFPDPETFDPDRFMSEREKALPRYAYFPFGAGARICIGSHFAMMEGQLLLATLAQRITFTLIPNQTVRPDPVHNLLLRPGGQVKVLVKRRYL